MRVARAVILAFALCATIGCARGPDARRLEAQLRRDLPVGTPSARIDAYLAAHGWMHDYLPQERSWLAGVRNVGSRFSLTREDLAIKIDLDGNKRLKSIHVNPLFTYHGR
jgi:hypothetical protein